MGNSKFKLADMIPNAWLFKRMDLSKGTGQANMNTNHSRKEKQDSSASTITKTHKANQNHPSNPRKSHYFSRNLIPGDESYTSPANLKVSESDCYTMYGTHTPRKSSKRRLRRTSAASPSTTKLVGSSFSSECKCRVKRESISSYPLDTCRESRTDRVLSTESFDEMVTWSSSCGYRVHSSANDIVIDVDQNSLAVQCDKLDDHDALSEIKLPPIVTKPAKFGDMVTDLKKDIKIKTNSRRSVNYEETRKQGTLRVKTAKEERHIAARRFSVSSPGVRLRIKSPKIASSKVEALRKSASSSTRSRNKSFSDSFAVEKSSFDPQRDFRDSMVEMIAENNIRESKDLEDLLACYLSLNSDEHHHLIIQVFKQLWFELVGTR